MNQIQWEAYERLQANLDKSDQVNDRSWGIEAALDAILVAIGNTEATPDIDIVIASAGRRERHRAYLRRVNAAAFDNPTDDRARIEARIQLARIARALPRHDGQLARYVATGVDYNTIAKLMGSSPGSLRVRMSRVRQALAPLAA